MDTDTYCTELACTWVVKLGSGREGSGSNEGDRDEDCDDVCAHREGLNRTSKLNVKWERGMSDSNKTTFVD